ncbi:MAG: hypothetical protein ACOX7X_10780 [Methanosarcina flavescens]
MIWWDILMHLRTNGAMNMYLQSPPRNDNENAIKDEQIHAEKG